MAKIINTSGKRKTAIARATLKPGNVGSASTPCLWRSTD